MSNETYPNLTIKIFLKKIFIFLTYVLYEFFNG